MDVVKASVGVLDLTASLHKANPELAGKLEALVGTMLEHLSYRGALLMPDVDGTVFCYRATAATKEFYSNPVAELISSAVM